MVSVLNVLEHIGRIDSAPLQLGKYENVKTIICPEYCNG